MDILQKLNHAVKYIEDHLCDDFDYEYVSEIACTSADGFQRFFSYMTGVTVYEYMRRRRLTKAAYELQNENQKVIDLAVKYGYASADSFARAFTKQHGTTPTEARRVGTKLTIYPPISFHILMKGRDEMNFRIVGKDAISLVGIKRSFEGGAQERWELEHELWAFERTLVSDKVPGVWYGIWSHGEYYVAKQYDVDCKEGLFEFAIPAGRYAVFESGLGGFAGDVLPELRKRIFEEWLRDSGYDIYQDYEVEVYHLFAKTEKNKRHYEMWIPIK